MVMTVGSRLELEREERVRCMISHISLGIVMTVGSGTFALEVPSVWNLSREREERREMYG